MLRKLSAFGGKSSKQLLTRVAPVNVTLKSVLSNTSIRGLGKTFFFQHITAMPIANKSLRAFSAKSEKSSLFAPAADNQRHKLHLNQLLKDSIEKLDERLISEWVYKKADLNELRFENVDDKTNRGSITAIMYVVQKMLLMRAEYKNHEAKILRDKYGIDYVGIKEMTDEYEHYEAQIRLIKYMISHASIENLNFANASGYTVLHYAAMSGKKDFIVELLKGGADPHAKLKNGKTPYDLYKDGFTHSNERFRSIDKNEIEDEFIKYMELRQFSSPQI